jgi:hypothetical protein
MYFRAWAKILLGVGEEVVRAGANEVGAADLRVCDGKLSIATLGTGTNELVRWKISCC